MLIDIDEWIYVREHVVPKDRMAIVDTHRTPHFAGFFDRLRGHAYAKILVHLLPSGKFSYELGHQRNIQEAILTYYRPVRQIAGIKGMESWRSYSMSMSEIVVLEPIPQNSGEPAKPAPAQQGEKR